jgi:hypothetical protein
MIGAIFYDNKLLENEKYYNIEDEKFYYNF